MSRTRTALVLAGVTGLLLAAPAAAGPKCTSPAAGAVHQAEETAAATPAGAVTTPVVHDVVEPVVCVLP